jgi:hypothetical protein
MGLPKKKRGFRIITIDSKKFNWRFAGEIDIRPEQQKDNRLLIDFGWFDEWLYVDNKASRPPDYEIKIVTPEFVRRAVLYALENNWDITKNRQTLKMVYRNGQFGTLNGQT